MLTRHAADASDSPTGVAQAEAAVLTFTDKYVSTVQSYVGNESAQRAAPSLGNGDTPAGATPGYLREHSRFGCLDAPGRCSATHLSASGRPIASPGGSRMEIVPSREAR